jgi:carbon monoxide dehydrogenase subunit G
MQMQGTRELHATAQQAWAALNDPEILRQCIPGCQTFELESPDVYAMVAAIKIGPVSAKFTGKIALTDIEPPHGYTLNFEAQGGVAGHGKGTSHVKLIETDHGVTLTYTVESQIGGKLAQLGQRLIDGAAKSMADDFFKRFELALADQAKGPARAEVPAEAATQAPPPRIREGVPRWLWIAIAAAVAVITLAYANA